MAGGLDALNLTLADIENELLTRKLQGKTISDQDYEERRPRGVRIDTSDWPDFDDDED